MKRHTGRVMDLGEREVVRMEDWEESREGKLVQMKRLEELKRML